MSHRHAVRRFSCRYHGNTLQGHLPLAIYGPGMGKKRRVDGKMERQVEMGDKEREEKTDNRNYRH